MAYVEQLYYETAVVVEFLQIYSIDVLSNLSAVFKYNCDHIVQIHTHSPALDSRRRSVIHFGILNVETRKKEYY